MVGWLSVYMVGSWLDSWLVCWWVVWLVGCLFIFFVHVCWLDGLVGELI